MAAFFERLWDNVASAAWWADNVLNFLIFVVVVAILVWAFEASRETRRRARYRGWRLRIVGFEDREQTLHWGEVERFLNSRFELWKFVKSVASGTVYLKLRTADAAIEAGWLNVDDAGKVITVDFSRIPPEHLRTENDEHPG